MRTPKKHGAVRWRLLVIAGFASGLGLGGGAAAQAANDWAITASMATARYGHTATLLPAGNVLVTGGWTGPNATASAELYNPTMGTWTATGNMTAARHSQTATLLPSGKVLAAGGWTGTSVIASAEVYDPSTGTWTATGNMTTGRREHMATLLSNGRVLVAGGYTGAGFAASAELYDPASGAWTVTGSMTAAREGATATLLPDGRVLVVGGRVGSSYQTSAELYDPATGMWTATASMATARWAHTTTLLPNGRVLVAGGYTGLTFTAAAELYDSATGAWANATSMATNHYQHTATPLADGRVLVAGGRTGSSLSALSELYSPSTGTWAAAASMNTARYLHRATLLPNGKVLVAGGWAGSSATALAELYTPADAAPPNAPPTASAGGPYSVPEGGSVGLTGSGSDPEGQPLTYTWDLDNNGTFETPGQNVTFSAASLDGPTTRTVVLRVCDNGSPSLCATSSATVNVTNVAPTPNAGGPYSVPEGGSLTLSGSATDPASCCGDTVVTWRWDLDSNGSFESPGQNVTFSAATLDGPSTRTVALQACDDDAGCGTASATVNVTNVAPTITSVTNNGPVNEGASAIITVTATDPAGPADTLVLRGDCNNDGTFETIPIEMVQLNLVSTAPITCTFPDNGSFRVNVQVTDGDGGTATGGTTVLVNNLPPTANAGGPYTVPEGGSVGLFGSGSDVPADTLTYAWDLDNNGTFETPGQNVTFSAAGLDGPSTRTVRLLVCDDDGACASPASATVNVTNVAPTITSVTNDGPVNEGSSATIMVSATDPAGAADTLVLRGDCNNDGTFETITIEMVQLNLVSSAPITCTFPDNGTLRVNVEVTDGDGGTATGGTFVSVLNVAPMVVFTAQAPVNQGSPFGLSLTNPFDPSSVDMGSLTYAFDCGDGSGYGPSSGNNTASCPTSDSGTRSVRGKIADKDGGCPLGRGPGFRLAPERRDGCATAAQPGGSAPWRVLSPRAIRSAN